MAKIAFIGAGSIVFTRALCSDILLAPALRDDACISLMDIDPHRLEQGRELVQRLDELAPRFGSKGQSGWFDFGRTGGYLRNCLYWAEHHDQEFRSLIDGSKPLPTARSHEYGSYIIQAIETGQPARINGNVPNTGLVSNLPEGCCVEVPCLVDSTGVLGVHAGSLCRHSSPR